MKSVLTKLELKDRQDICFYSPGNVLFHIHFIIYSLINVVSLFVFSLGIDFRQPLEPREVNLIASKYKCTTAQT